VSANGALRDLETAWAKRAGEPTVRVFHGPGESKGPLARLAIERFGAHYWVYEWETEGADQASDLRPSLDLVTSFLRDRGAESAVYLSRPVGQTPAPSPEVLFGSPPEHFDATEDGAKFRIRFRNTRHPGLFLDHRPLRQWLAREIGTRTALNTFAYTGSLSVASAIGGAARVVTLDLSKPTVQWAKENWDLNGLEASRGDFIFGDVFEWLPKLAKRGDRFGAVILDPPSFSRGTKGTFSTAKDLARLHELALGVLDRRGLLVTSINSAKVRHERYRDEVEAAGRAAKRRLREVAKLGAPRESFPGAGYLKGWIFEAD